MVIETALIILLGGIALLTVLPSIITRLGGGGAAVGLGQIIAFATMAGVLFYTGTIGLLVAVAIFAVPFVTRIVVVGYFYWLGKRALSGKMGEPQQWMAEMVEADDKEFMRAMDKLNRMQMKEVAVVADTKEELREEALERAGI